MKKILIGIPTFRRLEGLRKTLKSLEKIVLPTGVKVEVLVVENDQKKTVGKVVESFKKFPIHYVLEKNQGLVFVRNRILLEAKNINANYLAGIDDDEQVTPKWLISLWDVLQKTKSKVSTGPQIAVFDKSPPSWLIKGNFFVAKSTRETGHQMGRASTGNYLIDLSFLKKNNLGFDSRFNLVGAEDTDFFERIVQKGGKIVWSADAIVHESVPETRMMLKYLLKRDYRIGIGRAIRFSKKSRALGSLLSLFALIKAILYVMFLATKWTRATFFKQLCKITKQLGIFVGFFKGSFQAYGKN
ncbi:MAG: glycosyltransferase [Alphaproteobacteria bacterium]|nr:glycosyltransferase [Alphaproteobacteria bacterium]